MMLRPFLLIYRTRLIIVAIISVLSPALILYIMAAGSPFDVGVFWHHSCGCPPNPRDARALEDAFMFTSMIVPIILGMNAGFGGAKTPGLHGETRFLMTRPVPRHSLILQPLVVAAGACAMLPALGWLALLGWLRLVHAPSLGYMVTVAEMIPSVATLGAHPSFFALITALHIGRRYLAAFSVMLSVYTFLAMQRWVVLNPNPRIQSLGIFQFLIFYFPALQVSGPRFFQAMMLMVPKGSLGYVPSDLGIEVHLVLAVAFLYGAWLALQRVEV